jgi:hypothetical protein
MVLQLPALGERRNCHRVYVEQHTDQQLSVISQTSQISGTTEPTNGAIALIDVLHNLCDNVLTSASVATCHRTATAV